MGETAVARRTRAPWGANAGYGVRAIRERTELTDPALLEAIGSCAGQKVLDAGCGEGYMARHLTALGADVIGVDASRGLVEAATRFPPGGPFVCGSVDKLPLGDAVFDLVVCNHLFSRLDDPAGAIREFGRVLRSGGRLVILTLHPCFSAEDAENGGIPASPSLAPRRIGRHFPVGGLESPALPRPPEDYSAMLRDAGFVVTDLREPHPPDDSSQRDGFPVPLFILLIAERR